MTHHHRTVLSLSLSSSPLHTKRTSGAHVKNHVISPLLPLPQRCSLSEDLLKRLCAVDSSKPAFDLEEPALVGRMMDLFHGDSPNLVDKEPPAQLKRQPASTPGE